MKIENKLAYIKGTLEMKFDNYVVIDVGGLGYKVFMGEKTIEQIGNIGDTVKAFHLSLTVLVRYRSLGSI